MATLTFTLTIGAATVTRTKTMPDDHASRLLAWAQLQYGPLTNAQVFAATADAIMNGLRDNVASSERATAAKTALSGVTPIQIT